MFPADPHPRPALRRIARVAAAAALALLVPAVLAPVAASAAPMNATAAADPAAVPAAGPAAPVVPPAPKPPVVPIPAVPRLLPAGIEPLATYVPQTSCDPVAKPGTVLLGRLLTTTYPGTSAGIERSCGGGPNAVSEHFEGRALDWMDSVRDPRQAAQAAVVLRWLLAPDSRGNGYAYARRLGIMYLIWNNRIWSASDPLAGWQPYQDCASHPEPAYDTNCHRNHIHVSLTWAGAMGRTSFWTRQVVTATDYGPCRTADLNWAAPYHGINPTRCTRYPKVAARPGESAVKVALVAYSGAALRGGWTGPAVAAVQQALRTPTGPYSRATEAAVAAFQRAHGLPPTGLVNSWTWRALLRATR